MTWLKTIATELWGLFVDSGAMAIAVLIWLAVAGLALPRIEAFATYAGVVLFIGLAAILLTSVVRHARQQSGPS
jgi:membrane-bound ClpP family serine protease